MGLDDKDVNRFGVQIPIEEGDSGCPVFLFRNGHLEIGGIISMTSMGTRDMPSALRSAW